MKKDKIIYWTSTGLVALMMVFSGYSYFTNPQVTDGFRQMGFPDFFRIELGIAKVIAAVVLIVPQFPVKVKEWAYAGLGITFISAAILHIMRGDPTANIMSPIIFLIVLAVSNIYLGKVTEAKLQTA